VNPWIKDLQGGIVELKAGCKDDAFSGRKKMTEEMTGDCCGTGAAIRQM